MGDAGAAPEPARTGRSRPASAVERQPGPRRRAREALARCGPSRPGARRLPPGRLERAVGREAGRRSGRRRRARRRASPRAPSRPAALVDVDAPARSRGAGGRGPRRMPSFSATRTLRALPAAMIETDARAGRARPSPSRAPPARPPWPGRGPTTGARAASRTRRPGRTCGRDEGTASPQKPATSPSTSTAHSPKPWSSQWRSIVASSPRVSLRVSVRPVPMNRMTSASAHTAAKSSRSASGRNRRSTSRDVSTIMPGGCCLTPAEPARCRCVSCGPATGDDDRRADGGAPAPPAPDVGLAVARRCGGTRRAFAALYQRHHQALYRYCRSILRHDEDAQDALQSTMAKAFAALQNEQRDFELRPWLFRIAHNEAISILRRRRDAAELDAAAAVALGTDAGRARSRTASGCASCAATWRDLPERQRAALVLRELNGLGHEEIARGARTARPRAVKQTIFEARTALHECAEGREMACADVRRTLSDGDGRVLRGAALRAHLRACRVMPRASRRRSRSARPTSRALAPPLPVGGAARRCWPISAGRVRGRRRRRRGRRHRAPPRRRWLGAGVTAKVAVVAAVAVTATGAAGTAVHLEQRGGDPTVRHVQPPPRRRRRARRPAAPTSTRGSARGARPTSRDRPARPGAAPGRRRAAGGAAQHGGNPSGHGRPTARPGRRALQARRPVRRTGAAPRPAATPAGGPTERRAGRAAGQGLARRGRSRAAGRGAPPSPPARDGRARPARPRAASGRPGRPARRRPERTAGPRRARRRGRAGRHRPGAGPPASPDLRAPPALHP